MKTPNTCLFWILFLCVFVFAFSTSRADQSKAVSGKVITKVVQSASGKIAIEVTYTVSDTILLNTTPGSKSSANNKPVVLVPDGAPDWKQRQYLPGETFTVVFKFSFDKKQLPLTPLEVETFLPYSAVKLPKGPKKETQQEETQYCKAYAMVYFRGDKTVEIGNPLDFNRLDRAWFTASSNLTFKAVDPSQIPVSDLYPLEEIKEPWQDDYQLHFVEGLRYMVATKAVHPDTIAKYNNDDLPFGVVADSTFVDSGAPNGSVLSRGFRGVIRGRLVTAYFNDLGVTVQLPLAGVLVKLKEQDKVYNEEFASGHTDANGNFTLTYSRGQSFAEGKDLELFIKFKSKNETFDIKVKEHAILGGSYEAVHWIGHDIGQDVDIDLGDIDLENVNFRPLHWAFRCWTHAKSQGVPMFNDLSILTNRDEGDREGGSNFIGIIPGAMPVELRPTIRLTELATRIENTMYHEFGHFLMWQAQGRNYIVVPGLEGGDHTWPAENTTRLAWSEGWANAHEFILDAVLRDDDQEYGYDDSWPGLRVMEERSTDWERRISNGLQSEYFFACALYDLWDGADKGLPVNHPGSPRLHGFNDFITFATPASRWIAPEDISYSFRDIVKPLINHGGLANKIGNVWEYYNFFLKEVVGESCVERERVSRVFRENRVVFDLVAFLNEPGYGSMSTDDLGVKVQRTLGGTVYQGEVLGMDIFVPHIYDDEYFLSNYRTPGVTSNTIDFRFFPSSNMTLSDFDKFGWVDATGVAVTTTDINLNASANSGVANEKDGTLGMCARSGMIMTGGTLTLGGAPDYKATLEVGDQSVVAIEAAGGLVINGGSKIVVRSGGSLILRAGAHVSLFDNGTIIVEAGGFICIDPAVVLTLRDAESRIVLHEGAQTGINPLINLTGYCASPCGIAFSGSGAIVRETNTPVTVIGPSRVEAGSQNKFSVTPIRGSTYFWSVAGDATIVSGQHTHEVMVQAASAEFTIQVLSTNTMTCELHTGEFTVQVEGRVNALHFDGENDLVALSDRPDLNYGQDDFTFEVKFQSDFINTSFSPQILLSKRSFVDGSVADGFIVGILSTGEPFVQLGGAPNHFASRDVMDGKCHHLAVSRKGTAIKLFVDGELLLTSTSARSISSSRDLNIGRDVPVGLSFAGEIGEVRLWNAALGDQAIAGNIDTDNTGNETDLAGLWNMNTEEHSVITDLATGKAFALGTNDTGDNREPAWTFNSTCGFSMIRERVQFNNSRAKDFISSATPSQDSINNETSALLTSFPNPTSAETTLYVKSDYTHDLTLEIVDSFGNLVFRSDGYKTNQAIQIQTRWKPGIYIVRALNKGKIYEHKIVKP